MQGMGGVVSVRHRVLHSVHTERERAMTRVVFSRQDGNLPSHVIVTSAVVGDRRRICCYHALDELHPNEPQLGMELPSDGLSCNGGQVPAAQPHSYESRAGLQQILRLR